MKSVLGKTVCKRVLKYYVIRMIKLNVREMLHLKIIIFLCNFLGYSFHNIRKYGFVDGDIIIGVLLPIHEQPLFGVDTSECGDIREEYGMQRVEALIKTVNEINNNPNILRNFTLGLEIRDTCWDIPIALEQSLDIIKNIVNQRKMYSNLSMNDPMIQSDSINLNKKAITALIGPASSSITIEVQNLLQIFKIPQIGYSATSIDLSRKDMYKYFLRVVPSDKLQVKALIDLVLHFKWTYLSLVNTVGNYGTKGIKELSDQIENMDSVCIDRRMEVDDKDEMSTFENITKNLFTGERAKVIICFCQGETVKKLLKYIMQMNLFEKGFLIVGTDGWADRSDLLGALVEEESNKRELSAAAVGAITLRLKSKPLPDFDNYFRSKNYRNTKGNPWFKEFWEHKFKCSVDRNSLDKYHKLCSGNESLFNNKDYVQDSKLGFVVKSVMTVALGLHNLFKKQNIFRQNEYSGFMDIKGDLLLNEMLNVSFTGYDDETVTFDPNGDPSGRYEIMNYQYVYDKEKKQKVFRYTNVGSWKDNHLVINQQIMWPAKIRSFQSYCSKDCKPGRIKIYTRKLCCWKCAICKPQEFINGSHPFKEKCIKCPLGFLPMANKSGCEEIPDSFIQWREISSIIAVAFSCIGILVTAVIIGVLARYNNTPIVKSSTRELMYVILVGILIAYLTTFPLLSKPSVLTCVLTRITPGLSFALIFGSLVTKTNRIYRILAISKKKIILHAGRFLTTSAQLIIVLLLNTIEIVIICVMLWLEPPQPIKDYSSWNITNLICNTSPNSLFIPLGFDTILVCLCTWYAFKTRNLPENFNEAKFIGFTMYTTCIIWIGFVVIYFSTDLKVISLCFAINLTATISIVLLFMPKVFIILFEPEKNDRSAFTTTTDIRCHIGSGINNKTLSQSSSSLQKLKYHIDSIPLSKENYSRNESYSNKISLKSGLCQQNSNNGSLQPFMIKDSKVTQTEMSKLMHHLFNMSQCLNRTNDDFNLIQVALLKFLEDNWNSSRIPRFTSFNLPENINERVLCSEEEFMDEDYTK